MTHTASLIWITPNAEQVIVDCARVSSTKAPGSDGTALIKYLIAHKHWSPFEMASACFEINTSRAIARQILRHRSFSFQEFSQRYAEIGDVKPVISEARMKGATNRQSSLPTDDEGISLGWNTSQNIVWEDCVNAYNHALSQGIAPEVARVLLPEGMTPSRMFMAGTIRSWLHYVDLRTGPDTQAEHRKIALSVSRTLSQYIPTVFGALFDE